MAVQKLVHFEKLREILPSLYVGKKLNEWEQGVLMGAFTFASAPLAGGESWYQISAYKKDPQPITQHHLNALEEIYGYKFAPPKKLEEYM